jgi:Tol biopolymer transport system component
MIDIATETSFTVEAAPGVKFDPSLLPDGDVGYIRKDTIAPGAGIYYARGPRGPKGDIRSASWSRDGARVVFTRRLAFPMPTWKPMWSRNPKYELTLTGILPSFSPSGDRFVYTTRPIAPTVLGASLAIAKTGVDKSDIIFKDERRNVLAPQWSPKGDRIVFGVGVFNLFFNGFNGLLLKPGDRTEGGAQIAVINPDGTGYREVTSGPNNSAFPSFAPDGRRFVYRSFGPDGEGLRIMDIDTKAVTVLTNGYDNFPLWSPRGDLIMFSRLADGDYEIWTVKPDGTGAKQLTHSHGNDAHQAWSPDGEHIVFASARMGFKDEVVYTDAPQPYGELFVMRYDGTGVEQLTDNQWEEGTPAWQPAARPATPVTVLASGGFRAAFTDLLPQIENMLGVKVTMLTGPSQGTGPDTIGGQLRRGVAADMVIMSREGLDDLIAEKRIAHGTDVNLATLPLGDAELSIQQISELLSQAGAVVVGPVPKEIQSMSTFSAAVLNGARDPDVCRRLITFLASEASSDNIRRSGMAPQQ